MKLGSTGRENTQRRAFTLVEICVSLAVFTIAVLGLSAAMTSGSRLQVRTEEYALANRSIEEVHERMHSGDIDAQVASFKAAPVYEKGPLTVEVAFPEQMLVDRIGAPVPDSWRYKDLDADGQVDLNPTATSLATLVPVSVLVHWTGGEMRSSFFVTEK